MATSTDTSLYRKELNTESTEERGKTKREKRTD
jgi:hypothetical protein